MKQGKLGLMITLIISGVLLASSALAMEGHEQHKMSESMNHGQGVMIVLGELVHEGIKAMCQLIPIDSKMMPAGSKVSHHLMVMLSHPETGQPVQSGTVAVKIGSPDGKEGPPIRLMGMQGHFGADVVLDRPGIWHFRIAAKLADGKVRKYHGHHVL